MGAFAAPSYKAFAVLPNRDRYQTIAEVEARLSYDQEALSALGVACRQKSTQRGAWNLLLLACGRRLKSYLKTEELDALLKWLVEAIDKGAKPLSYLKRAVFNARKSREASQERDTDAAETLRDSGALDLVYEGEARVWASWSPASDPFLKKKLQAALKELTPQQRRAFILVEVEGLTGPEAGEEMALAPKTVRNLASEARKILRDTLGNVSAND